MTTRTSTRRHGNPHSDPDLLLVADDPNVSRFVRLPGASDTPSVPLAKAIETAVAAGIVVEFYAAHEDQAPAFWLQVGRGVIQVSDSQGRPAGTFATAGAAVRHGWERARRSGLK